MGGKAFSNTRPVNKTEVFEVLVSLGRQLNTGNYFCNNGLGSAGRARSSGDIDVNMDLNRFGFADIAIQLTNLLGADNVKSRPGTNQIFTSYEIPHSVDRVQVDFMFTEYPLWQEFSYASPGDHSAFKGLYRTELIKAAVAHNSNWCAHENGELIARIGPTFFHDRGLVWRHRHRPMRRDGTARVKEFVEISPEEFRAAYAGCAVVENRALVDPVDVSELLFDEPGRHMDSFFSYETLSDTLRSFYDASNYHSILQIYLERLNSLKVDVPKEIADEIHSSADRS